jgi:AcrR family transcriptional regulator
MTARKAGGTSGKTATSRRAGAKSRRSAAGRVGDGWQAEKSALTRQAILEAAVRCFVEHGYANTTTAMIADEASVSRGAMMHHFPSRSAAMNAVVGYLHVRRLNEYRALMTDIDSPDQTLTRAAIRVSVESAWKQVKSLQAAHDLVQFVMQGMGVAHRSSNREQRANRVIEAVTDHLERIYLADTGEGEH